jgi:hypothetical protein
LEIKALLIETHTPALNLAQFLIGIQPGTLLT